ncbi:NAD-dependent epimerase/dehydratase family protein, partial [Corynebacterium sp.]|uniref:NAD-dependent epimerase/dehydratase family protein n=1 Tax=Corynebacterium sp. TaxID=1720 RepID=UPI0027B9DCAF
MNFLLLGGTGFLGGHIAAAAVERGHQVTCLARGNGKVPNGAEFVSSDRDRDSAYDEIAGKTWDTIVDLTSQPKHARDAAVKLQAKHRIFVSSSSVYEDQGSISSESDSVVTPLEI